MGIITVSGDTAANMVYVPLIAGNFYLCWLLLVTVAFLYNAAVGPLRTAFSPAPVYNLTGVYPSSAAAATDVTTSDVTAGSDCVVNETSVLSSDVTTSYPSLSVTAGNVSNRVSNINKLLKY